MDLIMIGAQLSSKAYATNLNEESVEAALRTAVTMEDETGYRPHFVINVDGGECLRVIRAKGSDAVGYSGPEYDVSDTAYDIVGIETLDEYFQTATQPITED
jgi:hypothetical protein